MSTFAAVLAFSLIPVVTMALGAGIAAVRAPGERVRSAIQHFAAGVVFAVVAVELLPDLKEIHDPIEVIGGFALGLIFMLLLERWTGAHEHEEKSGRGSGSAGLLAAVGIDLLLDGLLVGIAFAAGASAGVLLSIALAFELLSLGLALSVDLSRSGASAVRAILVPVGLALVTLVGGALLGSTVLSNASEAVLATVLAFGSAALLFLVTEGLLVEAHEVGETPWATAMFFIGFLFIVILGMLG